MTYKNTQLDVEGSRPNKAFPAISYLIVILLIAIIPTLL
jgi:hypothetical protein